jgi:hypothetical protein
MITYQIKSSEHLPHIAQGTCKTTEHVLVLQGEKKHVGMFARELDAAHAIAREERQQQNGKEDAT